MELKLQEYIVAIEKNGNMTEASKQLFITPSALNQQLLRLEKELGVPLFTRNRRKLVPTEAGRIYLDAAHQMLALQQSVCARLADLSACHSGTYHVGLTFEHGTDLFARIYPLFHQKYPGISVQCHQLLVPEMLDMLRRGELTLAFILTGNPSRHTDVEYRKLSEENLLLGLPRSHRFAYLGTPPDDPCTTIDLRLLEKDSFCMALENSTMRQDLINPIFVQENIQPHVIMESSFNGFLEQLAALGMCNTIIPQSRVHNRQDIVWFYLPGQPRFQFGVTYQKGFVLNKALRYFIELAHQDAMCHMNFPAPASDRAPLHRAEAPGKRS